MLARLFQEFSVFDNVLVGCHLRAHRAILPTLLGLDKGSRGAATEKTREILEFFDLLPLADELAMSLPHGLQRALGMAVAVAATPTMLLLHEPFTGMNPVETRHMMGLVERVHERGVTILLVEHDMQAVMGLCHTITVLDFGRRLAEGTPEQVRRHPDVVAAYLVYCPANKLRISTAPEPPAVVATRRNSDGYCSSSRLVW